MGHAARLELIDLACSRGGRMLFEEVNLSLGAGDAALVTGPNGVGKSSLLRVIAGLLEPAAGNIESEGTVALADDRAALDADLSLAKALNFWAKIDGAGSVALEAMGMAHLAAVPVRMLSTGQRKRASLARVAASGAAIWLLDEPGNGLDEAGLMLLEQLVAGHRSSGGIAVVATHQPINVPGAKVIAF